MILELKFWDYYEKNMDFHLTLKKVLLLEALGDENVMATSYLSTKA